jgi:hypothetical protein
MEEDNIRSPLADVKVVLELACSQMKDILKRKRARDPIMAIEAGLRIGFVEGWHLRVHICCDPRYPSKLFYRRLLKRVLVVQRAILAAPAVLFHGQAPVEWVPQHHNDQAFGQVAGVEVRELKSVLESLTVYLQGVCLPTEPLIHKEVIRLVIKRGPQQVSDKIGA